MGQAKLRGTKEQRVREGELKEAIRQQQLVEQKRQLRIKRQEEYAAMSPTERKRARQKQELLSTIVALAASTVL